MKCNPMLCGAIAALSFVLGMGSGMLSAQPEAAGADRLAR